MKFGYSFQGKKVLITGGTKGLGLATAKRFAHNGAELFLSYRSDEASAQKAVESIREMGARCEVFRSDLSESHGIDALFENLNKTTTTLDIYIHNAAATAFKDLLDLQSHHIDKTLNITIKGFILGVQKATAMMPVSGGAVVAVSGMDTLRAVPRHGLLGAAKAALETLTTYYAHELASRKIRVNAVNPGFFETDSTRKYLGPAFDAVMAQTARMSPLKRPATLDEIANAILFLSSDLSQWMVGQTLCVDGGFNSALSF